MKTASVLNSKKTFLFLFLFLGLLALIEWFYQRQNKVISPHDLVTAVEVSNNQITTVLTPDMKSDANSQTAAALSSCAGIQLKKTESFSLEKLKQLLIGQYQLSPAILEEEVYFLKNSRGQNLRVVVDEKQERSEQVKVYLIDQDGYPDVVKGYPRHESNLLSDRVSGALGLGTLDKQIKKIKAESSTDPSITLQYEINRDVLTSINFVNVLNELNCNSKECFCIHH